MYFAVNDQENSNLLCQTQHNWPAHLAQLVQQLEPNTTFHRRIKPHAPHTRSHMASSSSPELKTPWKTIWRCGNDPTYVMQQLLLEIHRINYESASSTGRDSGIRLSKQNGPASKGVSLPLRKFSTVSFIASIQILFIRPHSSTSKSLPLFQCSYHWQLSSSSFLDYINHVHSCLKTSTHTYLNTNKVK